jgi:hypothetical protein
MIAYKQMTEQSLLNSQICKQSDKGPMFECTRTLIFLKKLRALRFVVVIGGPYSRSRELIVLVF